MRQLLQLSLLKHPLFLLLVHNDSFRNWWFQNSPIDEQLSIGDKSTVKRSWENRCSSLRFETERKNRDRRGKSTAMGGGSPWNVYFAFRDLSNGVIPVELNSLGGRWSFNAGDINLAHDIISSSLSMTRENLSPMKFSLPFLAVSYFFFLFGDTQQQTIIRIFLFASEKSN